MQSLFAPVTRLPPTTLSAKEQSISKTGGWMLLASQTPAVFHTISSATHQA